MYKFIQISCFVSGLYVCMWHLMGIYLRICDGIVADLMENDECELSLPPSSWYSDFAGMLARFDTTNRFRLVFVRYNGTNTHG